MRRFGVVLVLAGLAFGCGKNEAPPPKQRLAIEQESGPRGSAASHGGAGAVAAAPGGALGEAQQIFASKCSLCHGAEGQGNGPAAENLTPKPRNYRDAAWQASVTDEEIAKTIVKGGQAVGKSGMMPGNPDLESKPQVVAALVSIIRGFGKQ